MPPFLTKGMCAGILDAHTLAWKLALVLDGLAPPALLDTYQPEREPHVRAITGKANELGRVQTLRNPETGWQRDVELLRRRAENRQPKKLRLQPYRTGPVADETAGAGELFVQGAVRSGSAEGLFDEKVAELAPGSATALEDRAGVYTEWFTAHGGDTALVRPGWYVSGTASGSGGLATLLDDLECRIAA